MGEIQQRAIHTPATLASLWGCSERDVLDVLRDGRLPHFRIGPRMPRVKREAIEGKTLSDFVSAEPTISPAPPKNRMAQSIRREIGPSSAMPRGGSVYFIKSGRYVKVGFSTSPRERLHAIEGMNPDVELLGTIAGTLVTERILHKRLKKWHHRNEWFRLTAYLAHTIRGLCDA